MSLPALARQAGAGLRVLLGLTLVLGLAYPLAVTAVAQVVFPRQANGSLVEHDGAIVGSALLGQPFDGPQWFHPRPSAAGDGDDPLASGGSNLGPESAVLLAEVTQRRAAVAAENGVDPAAVPPDAVTASGSGLDPHISPEYALLQVPRVAAARGLDPVAVRALVEQHIQGRPLGFLGAERVTVLDLNRALQELH